jgi:hypothetical protein
MIFKCLAAAGLAASLATGGAIAVQTSSATPPAATVTVAPASGAPAPAAGVDDHAEVDETTTTSTTAPAPSTVATTAPAPVPTVTVFPAGDAGSVTLSVSGGMVTVAAVTPNAGWTVESEHGAGHEAKVSFRNGLRRIEFKAEFEDGRLQTRVDDHAEGDGHDQPAVSTPPAAGGNAVAGDDDGHAEVENEQASDDHSGPGHDGSDDSSVSSGTTASGSSTFSGSSDNGDRSGRDGGGGHDGRDG